MGQSKRLQIRDVRVERIAPNPLPQWNQRPLFIPAMHPTNRAVRA